METPGSQSGTGAVSPDDADSEDAISTGDHSHPRMLYVAVEQNEDSYPFHQSRVSPLDPNLNSAQYSPTTRATTLLHQDSHIICPEGELQYTPNLHDSNLTSDHFSPSTPDIIMDARYSSTGRLHNSRHLITQESIESAHFSPENTNLLTQDSNLSEGAFEHGISYASRNLSEMDVNLAQSDYQTHSLLDQIQNVSSRNNIDFGSLANLSDNSYVMQLNTGQLLLKTINGRYYQQVFHPNNIIINSHLYESNDMLSDNILTLSDNGVTRLSDDVLTDIQNGEDSIITNTDSIIRLSDNILNRDLEFNRFVHASNINNLLSNQKSIKTDEDSRITALKSNIKKHKFQSISAELLSNNDSTSDISSEVFTITPHLANEVLSNGKLEEPDFNPDAVVENSNQGSIQTMLKNISEGDFSSDVYEMAPVYELADQDRDTCLVDDSDDIDIRDSKYSGEEFVLIDGGIYSLSNLKSQGFVIGQSGEILLSQQSDGHLLNSNPNFGLNYNDQIVIDQNGRIMLKSSMDKDDTLLLHEAELNNMNVDDNLDEELELNHDIKAEVFGLKSDVIFEEECILDNCEAQELKPDQTKDSREMSKSVEGLRRSKRAVKVKADKDILTINDKQVQARAWGTLPAAYLSISKVAENDKKPVYGVLARKVIPACTQFGPVNGFKTTAQTKSEIVTLEFKVKTDDGIVYLDVADEHLSNWMRFVRPADTFSEQNLVMTEQTGLLYFTSIKTIGIKTELRVWYGDEYAKEYGFHLLRPTESEKQVISKMENSWPCYECGERLASSEDLQIHLNEHDDIRISIEEKRLVRARRIRLAAHIQKLNPNTQEKDVASDTERKRLVHQCSVCDRIFPRAYSLNRHLLTHRGSGNALAQRKRLLPSPIMSNENNQNDSNHNESEIHTDRIALVRSESINVCEDDIKVKTNNDISILPHSTEEDAQSYHQDKQYKFIKPTTKFLCHLCPRRFVTKDKLDHHLSDHEESSEEYVKKFICTHCFKEFSNSTLLMCHVKTHMTLKCPMCEKIFSAVLDLREHVKAHCVDGYYTCSSCRKKFSDYSVIRKHIRAFHCEKKIPCPQCSKLFPKRDKLRMHLLKHSDHREFLCAHCGKQFKRKDKLKEHTKRIHSGSKPAINGLLKQSYLVECKMEKNSKHKRFMPKVSPNDYHRFIYKCHTCLLGFKRRGMLVNHLAKRHPDIKPESVPELNLPILKTTRDYYCQYCQKVYKSSSKRKAHILKNHPGLELPLSNRHKGGVPDIPGIPNPTFSQTVGSVTTHPHACLWCHKQYASKAKLLQHQRKKHTELLNSAQQMTVTQTEAAPSPNLKESNYEVVTPNPNQYLKIVSSDTKMTKGTNMTLLETDVDFESDPDDPEMLTEPDLEKGKKKKNTKDIVNDKQIKGRTDNMTNRAVVELTDVEESRVNSSKLFMKNNKMSMKTYNLPEIKSLSLTASELKHQKKWAVNYPFTSFAAR